MRSAGLSRAIGVFLFAVAAGATVATAQDRPSRKALNGCKWEKATNAEVGLSAWVQRCEFGFRKIDFLFVKSSLAIRYSDAGTGAPDPVVDVLDLKEGETPEAGVKRIFAERTAKEVASRCVLTPYRTGGTPAGVKRYTFFPNDAYMKELDAKAKPDEVPEPPCGDWGTAPDGIQYFEAQPFRSARKVLFVRAGQDEPLFDERTLTLLPGR